MSAVYLSSLNLSGFRSYKSTTQVTFPAGPGLTVIVGPNGFGKSTLFDAIEWALTGELKRIESVSAKEKEKKGAIGTAPLVQLSFSDGTTVNTDRNGVSVNCALGQRDISEWLVVPGWRGLKNISECLQFTHFLGQSTRQQFVHQDGSERWNRLEGPAGLETMKHMLQILGSSRVTVAFNKMLEEREQREETIWKTVQKVERLKSAIEQSRDLARASSAISADEIRVRCGEIREQLSGIYLSTSEIYVESVDQLLQQQQKEIEKAKSVISEESARLAQWLGKAEEFARIAHEEAQKSLEKDACETSCREAEALEVEGQKRLFAARNAKIEADTRAKDLQLEIEALKQAISERQKIDELDKKIFDLDAALLRTVSRIAEHSTSTAASRSLLASIVARRDRCENSLSRRRSLVELRSRCEAFLTLDKQRQIAKLRLTALPQAEQQQRDERAALLDNKRKCEAAVAQFKAQRAAASEAATAISAAVAQIAAALRQEDCTCPVCKSTFDEQGLLKQLASGQAEHLDKRLAAAEVGLESAVRALDENSERLALSEKKELVLREERVRYNADINRAVELELAIRANPLFATLTSEEYLQVVDVELTTVDREIADISAESSNVPAETVVKTELSQLEALTKGAEDERESKTRELAVLKTQRNALQEVHSLRRIHDVDGLDRLLADRKLTEERELEVLGGLRREFDQNSILAEQAAQRVHENRRLLNSVNSALATLSSSKKVLVDDWKSFNHAQTPSTAAVLALQTTLNTKDRLLEKLTADHEQLVEGRRQYLALSELGRLEGELREHCEQEGAASEGELSSALRAQQTELHTEVERLRKVRQKRDALQARMKERTDKVRELVSVPLNESIKKFCAALMSDRDYHVRLDAIANAVSAQALLSFQREGDDMGTRKNPLLYMSEGQLAAVSLCLLLGASVTYPWSRWKGLLLDDPLHHNDSIHTAAFIDVARNLIKKQSYQIVVSTHDMEQAGYFLRKCANAGISARYWHLYGRAADGTALMQKGEH
ncbi:AAA family ATPase [Paraburkholderia sediminicola]|uniref:AAA family ATPase n=1 Tax=Paraburkholderia sediminicola TaxID=458836 RepID=UPI0038B7B6AC